MSNYSKINFIYFMQKWMDSVAGQTFLNYAYSWGAAIVILGTLFKLTHLPGANEMLFVGMGTEVLVFFISAFDRPFDKTTIDMTLDNHMVDINSDNAEAAQQGVSEGNGAAVAVMGNVNTDNNITESQAAAAAASAGTVGGTVIIGGGYVGGNAVATGVAGSSSVANTQPGEAISFANDSEQTAAEGGIATSVEARTTTPAPAVTQETAEAMEMATTTYVSRLNELNETFEKVAALSARLATDSEEMENLNRTLTGISRVYEMQLKSASQQINTQDEINEQTRILAQKIQELNAIYTRMIGAMTVNMNPMTPNMQ